MIFIKDMGVLELRVAQQKPSQTLVIFFLVVGEGNDKTSEGVALIFNIYIHYVYIYISMSSDSNVASFARVPR